VLRGGVEMFLNTRLLSLENVGCGLTALQVRTDAFIFAASFIFISLH
jgi:hypothetical protein